MGGWRVGGKRVVRSTIPLLSTANILYVKEVGGRLELFVCRHQVQQQDSPPAGT
mgnify:CR=1 FL=1